jgi:hypothetical protein
MNAATAVAELPDELIRCHACKGDLSPAIHAAPSMAQVLRNEPAGSWMSERGFAIAALVLAIGVGFLIPIVCSFLAIGVGVVAIRSSDAKGKAAKRMAIASVVLGVVGIIGAISVLVGA